jgi:dolichol-phosphate mannosyltransferase
MKTLDIVIPVFNEEECIVETVSRIKNVCLSLAEKFKVSIIFIDDGSKDRTFQILKMEAALFKNLKIVKLSRNFGHQLALTAGLDHSTADIIAILDGDLQDPPELLPAMIEKMSEGYDIVYGQRKKREGETIFKRLTAAAFYRVLSRMCDIEIPQDTGDFRVISNRVLLALKSMRERHRFIRGLVPYSGFKSYAFSYQRKTRFAGDTKYPFKKMIRFAFDAIFSFSTKPIKIMRYYGLISVGLSILFFFYILYLRLFSSAVVPGLTVIITLIIFFGGIQILSISLLGEYVGRIFEEVKSRPLYFVEEFVNGE